MLQNVKKALANPEPSTQTWTARKVTESVLEGKADFVDTTADFRKSPHEKHQVAVAKSDLSSILCSILRCAAARTIAEHDLPLGN